MHSSDSRVEPEHAGAWRGLFDHKNITGAMMGVFVMVGLFAARAGYPVLGWGVAIAAFIFLFFTKSKTTMALTPFVLLWAMFAHRLESRWLRPLVCLGPLVLMPDLHRRLRPVAAGESNSRSCLTRPDLYRANRNLGFRL